MFQQDLAVITFSCFVLKLTLLFCFTLCFCKGLKFPSLYMIQHMLHLFRFLIISKTTICNQCCFFVCSVLLLLLLLPLVLLVSFWFCNGFLLAQVLLGLLLIGEGEGETLMGHSAIGCSYMAHILYRQPASINTKNPLR